MYAIYQSVFNYPSWLGILPVLVLKYHNPLKEWDIEVVDTTSGPTCRRLRWQEFLESFNEQVLRIEGNKKTVADALSRWAYPASTGYRNMSKHGFQQDVVDVRKLNEESAAYEATGIFNTTASYDERVNAKVLDKYAFAVAPAEAEAEM